MGISVTKIFDFQSAHYLPGYDGKCANVHGHRWVVEIEYSGSIWAKSGMVLDFHNIKAVVEPLIDKLDHQTLNDILYMPTAENLVEYFRENLPISIERAALTRIRIYEAPDSYAEWRKE